MIIVTVDVKLTALFELELYRIEVLASVVPADV